MWNPRLYHMPYVLTHTVACELILYSEEPLSAREEKKRLIDGKL